MPKNFNCSSVVALIAILILSIMVVAQDKSQNQQSKQQRKAEAKQQAAEQQPRAEAGATSTSRLALPFKRAWQYITNDALTVAPTLDETRIYLPLAGGRV